MSNFTLACVGNFFAGMVAMFLFVIWYGNKHRKDKDE